MYKMLHQVPALALHDQVDDEWLEEDMPTTARKLSKKSSYQEPHYQESHYQGLENLNQPKK